ncbi:MAG: ABC transporter ATP-binding protein [Nakamurella sp.]
MMTHLLEVEHLAVSFGHGERAVPAVLDVTFEVDAGELVCIVGESGSGKSVTAKTVLGLTRLQGATVAGAVRFDNHDLLDAGEKHLRSVRGAQIGFVFQDAMNALDPVQRVGAQIVEQLRVHRPLSRWAARQESVALLARAGIPDPATRARAYPHQLSGGLCQRVMIAIALACGPRLIIADEPTTALDVTIQAQVLVELRRLCREDGIGVLLITHDLGVVAEVADRVVVMYAGRIVEQGTVAQVFTRPLHPYTVGLLRSMPRIDRPREATLQAIAGTPSSAAVAGEGCSFAPRCPHRFAACTALPPLTQIDDGGGHTARCWLDSSALPVTEAP